MAILAPGLSEVITSQCLFARVVWVNLSVPRSFAQVMFPLLIFLKWHGIHAIFLGLIIFLNPFLLPLVILKDTSLTR